MQHLHAWPYHSQSYTQLHITSVLDVARHRLEKDNKQDRGCFVVVSTDPRCTSRGYSLENIFEAVTIYVTELKS